MLVSRNANNSLQVAMPDYGIEQQTLESLEENVFFYFDPVWSTYFELTFWPGENDDIRYISTRLGVAERVVP